MTRLLIIILAPLVAVAACSSAVAGRAAPDKTAVTPITTATLGDGPTIDYCSLLDPKETGIEPTDGLSRSLDFCWLTTTVESSTVDLFAAARDTTDDWNHPDGLDPMWLPGGLRIREWGDLPDDRCVRNLVLTDGAAIGFETRVAEEHGPVTRAALCEVADKALLGAVEVIRTGRVAHLRNDQNRSFGEVNACAVLSESAVSEAIGAAAASREFLSGHRCRWGPDSGYAELYFMFDVMEGVIEDATNVELGGRPSFVAPAGENCEVRTPHREVEVNGESSDEIEVAVLFVHLAGADPCAVGKELAARAWPQLPAYL